MKNLGIYAVFWAILLMLSNCEFKKEFFANSNNSIEYELVKGYTFAKISEVFGVKIDLQKDRVELSTSIKQEVFERKIGKELFEFLTDSTNLIYDSRLVNTHYSHYKDNEKDGYIKVNIRRIKKQIQ